MQDPKEHFSSTFHIRVSPYHLYQRPSHQKEFDEIKRTRSRIDILKEMHIFVALCASLHQCIDDKWLRSLAQGLSAHRWVRVAQRHPISFLSRPLTRTSRNDGVGNSLKSALGTLPAYRPYTEPSRTKEI